MRPALSKNPHSSNSKKKRHRPFKKKRPSQNTPGQESSKDTGGSVSEKKGGNKNSRSHNRHHRPSRSSSSQDQRSRSDQNRRPSQNQSSEERKSSPFHTSKEPIKAPPPQPSAKKINYGVIFFDTLQKAKADLSGIEAKAKTCDRLNIVIRAEGPQSDPDLDPLGHVYSGAAWAVIHDRRQEDGWYEQPQEENISQ